MATRQRRPPLQAARGRPPIRRRPPSRILGLLRLALATAVIAIVGLVLLDQGGGGRSSRKRVTPFASGPVLPDVTSAAHAYSQADGTPAPASSVVWRLTPATERAIAPDLAVRHGGDARAQVAL